MARVVVDVVDGVRGKERTHTSAFLSGHTMMIPIITRMTTHLYFRERVMGMCTGWWPSDVDDGECIQPSVEERDGEELCQDHVNAGSVFPADDVHRPLF